MNNGKVKDPCSVPVTQQCHLLVRVRVFRCVCVCVLLSEKQESCAENSLEANVYNYQTCDNCKLLPLLIIVSPLLLCALCRQACLQPQQIEGGSYIGECLHSHPLTWPTDSMQQRIRQGKKGGTMLEQLQRLVAALSC